MVCDWAWGAVEEKRALPGSPWIGGKLWRIHGAHLLSSLGWQTHHILAGRWLRRVHSANLLSRLGLICMLNHWRLHRAQHSRCRGRCVRCRRHVVSGLRTMLPELRDIQELYIRCFISVQKTRQERRSLDIYYTWPSGHALFSRVVVP